MFHIQHYLDIYSVLGKDSIASDENSVDNSGYFIDGHCSSAPTYSNCRSFPIDKDAASSDDSFMGVAEVAKTVPRKCYENDDENVYFPVKSKAKGAIFKEAAKCSFIKYTEKENVWQGGC